MDLPERVGRYAVEVMLWEGAVHRTLLARDPVLERPVSIVVVRDDADLTPDEAARAAEGLRQDARALGSLSHPGIAAVHDMGEGALEDASTRTAPNAGTASDEPRGAGPYVVFELVAGTSLRERLTQGPLSAEETATLARALGAALTHAHLAGIVHGAIEPKNVMLAAAGPKIVAFGLARRDAELGGAAARDDARIVSPKAARSATRAAIDDWTAYGAPEALRASTFNASSDQFSLAAVLYEALTGACPFSGDSRADRTQRIAAAKHPSPTRVRPDLRRFAHVDAIFDRALAKDTRLRFPSCEAFTSILAAELDGSSATSSAAPPPHSSIVPRATRRWQNIIVAVAILVILALLLVGRERRAEHEGVSLRHLAGAFASAATPPRAAVPLPRRDAPRPAASIGAPAPPSISASVTPSPTPAPSVPSSPSASAPAGHGATTAPSSRAPEEP